MSFGFGFGFSHNRPFAGGPSLNFQFAGATTLDPRITFTRASTGTFFNSSGVLTSAAINAPRFDYNPSTLAARGLLIEEQRTNSIRNNTMVGAVAGTPGTLPTNWQTFITGAGISREVIGTGTENGVNYIDIRFFGTPSAGGVFSIQCEPNNGVGALNGQSWTYSAYIKLVGGSIANVASSQIYIDEYSSTPSYLTGQLTNISYPTSATARVSATRTNNNASTAFVVAGLRYGFNLGAAIDITLRIGLPQLEQGAFATSVIPTTTTALTRNVDSASMTGANFSSWYNATEGTFFTESQILYSTGGVIFPGVLSANNGTTTNQILAYYINTNRQTLYVRTGGTVVADIGPAASANIVFKFAGAYKENDFAATTNGAAVSTDTTGTLPPAVDRLNIGSQAVLSQPLNGYLRRITYYPRRLSNAELQAITS